MSVFHVPRVSATDRARAAVALQRFAEHVDALRTRAPCGEDVSMNALRLSRPLTVSIRRERIEQ